MNLFIDTNIFLSFYHFSSDDLEEIQKLSVLLDKKDVVLWLPEQVKDEFSRNRESRLGDALRKLKEQQGKAQFPQICKEYDEYEEIRKLQSETQEKLTSLINKVNEDVFRRTLKADEQITRLFSKARIDMPSDDIIRRAELRVRVGNPPGKDGSLGDAINWETLLENIEDEEDLYIITDDKDFYSVLDNHKIKDYLFDEWKDKKQAKVYCFQRLSQFFSKYYPQIKLATELEKQLSIRDLEESVSFWHTHRAIENLQGYEEFDEQQVNQIVEAFVSNPQISRIRCDEDVYSFYQNVCNRYIAIINPESLARIEKLLQECDDE